MNFLASYFHRSGRFSYLLGSLLCLLIASAFFEEAKALFNALLSVTLLSSVYAISHDRRFLVTGLIIAIATFLCAWLAQMLTSQLLGLVSSFLGFDFFSSPQRSFSCISSGHRRSRSTSYSARSVPTCCSESAAVSSSSFWKSLIRTPCSAPLTWSST